MKNFANDTRLVLPNDFCPSEPIPNIAKMNLGVSLWILSYKT